MVNYSYHRIGLYFYHDEKKISRLRVKGSTSFINSLRDLGPASSPIWVSCPSLALQFCDSGTKENKKARTR